MANETWALKLDSELKEKIQDIIKNDFESSQDFMQSLLNSYQTEKLNNSSDVLKGDIETVNRAVRQIQEVFIGVNAKLASMQDDYNNSLATTKQSQEQEKQLYKEKIDKLKADNESISSINDSLVNSNQEYIQEVNQLTKSNNTLEQLVSEYKEKNDTLTGLLAEYKEDREQNKNLQEENRDLKNKLHELNVAATEQAKRIVEADEKIKAQSQEYDKKIQDQSETYTNKIQELRAKHDEELNAVKSRAELEANMKILAIQAEHQSKMQALQEKHNAEVAQYQAKYRELLEQIEQKKAAKTIANIRTQTKTDK